MANKRLYPLNLRTEYPDAKGTPQSFTISGKKALLQKDYGKAQDCTLTSLTYIVQSMIRNCQVEEIYDNVEASALKHGYNGDKNGTNPLVIKRIMMQVFSNYGINKRCKSGYMKGIGWSYKSLKSILRNGNKYAILNLSNDGRGYYKNHSVTVIGYVEYENHRFITVYDNWNNSVSYIDYNKLSAISSINWYE